MNKLFSHKIVTSRYFDKIKEIIFAIIAVIAALIIGGILLLFVDRDPIEAYIALFKGAFGGMDYFGDTLSKSTPIIFTGLSVAVAFKCGLFNIGAEGQLLVGTIGAAVAGYYIKGLPGYIHFIVTIIVGILFAAIWAIIPAILKALRGVHEVITTIMLNYISYSLIAYIIEKLRTSEVPKTPDILDSARLSKLSEWFGVFKNSEVSVGFVIAIVACIGINFLLKKTVIGYEIRAVGINSAAAQTGGIRITKNIIYAMVISGILAGFAGVEMVSGVHYSLKPGISPGYGFDGIAVALLANNNPIGIIFTGIIFGALASGGLYMDMVAQVSPDIVKIIQGLIIFFAAGNQVFKFISAKKKKRGGI